MTTTLRAELGFVRPGSVTPDHDRPALGRAATIDADPITAEHLDVHRCELVDLAATEADPVHLDRDGFEPVALPATPGLRPLLTQIRDRRVIEPADATRLRRLLVKRSIRLADGSRLKLVHVAAEGVILRIAGPDGISLDESGLDGEHGGAEFIHADQDVAGTPLRQMLRGVAPRLFRHEAPDSTNRRSPVVLVNLWMPLRQATRPLTLLDTATLDRGRHQVRYGEPVGDYLEGRDPDRAINDIWGLVHDPAQRWCIHSELELGEAHVFDTLSTPHGTCVLPGEDAAADRFRQLQSALTALDDGDADRLRDAARGASDSSNLTTTARLAAAIAEMDHTLAEAAEGAERLVADATAATRWRSRAVAARDTVVRMSVEVRVVGLRLPR